LARNGYLERAIFELQIAYAVEQCALVDQVSEGVSAVVVTGFGRDGRRNSRDRKEVTRAMRVLGSAVITMEFFVMGFALLLAKDHHSATALWIGGVIAILCLLTAGMMRNIRGWYIGTLVQVALIAYGVVVPMMYFMGRPLRGFMGERLYRWAQRVGP
jgi:hypothetical protein